MNSAKGKTNAQVFALFASQKGRLVALLPALLNVRKDLSGSCLGVASLLEPQRRCGRPREAPALIVLED